jgi:putative phosphoesterase
MATRIGVVSDTHGLIRPQMLSALEGVEAIVHAGDVGSPDVLDALLKIAPVYAIRGNVDTEAWARELPETREVQIESARLFVIHNIAELKVERANYSAIVFGHSHRALEEVRSGVMYLNPGSAGPRRFSLPVTLMTLVVDGSELRPELITLVP